MRQSFELTISIVEKFGRFVSSAHLIKHHTEGPHIDLGTHQGVLGLDLGGDVATCATSINHQSFSVELWLHHVTQAEVA